MAVKTQATKYQGVYQRGSRFSYVISMKTPEGRWKQEWTGGFDTAAKAKKAREAAVIDNRRGDHVQRSSRTVGEYLAEWIEGRVNLKPTTIHGYRATINTHIIPALGTVKLQDLTTTRLNAFYRQLHQPADPKRRPLSPRTVQLCHATLRKALNDAVRVGELKVNPTLHATVPRQEKPNLAEPWNAQEVGLFLRSIDGEPLKAAFVLAATTGARRGEIAGLRWKDVDLDGRKIRVARPRTTVSGGVVEGSPKNKTSERIIAIDERTASALREHRAMQAEQRMALGLGRASRDDCVFQEPDGSGINPNRLAREFQSAARRIGLPRVRFHDLRHSFASIALMNGVPVEVVSKRLGHASPIVTLTIYRHVLAEEDQAAVEAFGDAVYGVEIAERSKA